MNADPHGPSPSPSPGPSPGPGPDADAVLGHALADGRWARANRELLAKILTELWFEDVLFPEDLGAGRYRLVLADHELRFAATPRLLGHHRVDPDSLVDPPEVAELLAAVGPVLGMDPSTLANAIIELTNTLVADAHQLASGRPAAELVELIDRDPLAVEAELRAHPWIVANKGRLGFDRLDHLAYAPERQQPFGLQWLAVRAERADFRSWPGLDQATLLADQLGPEGSAALQRALAAHGLDPTEVVIVPVHPWQWKERIATLHAADLAAGRIVVLGDLGPTYRAQQSIRTLVDADHPQRRYLKVALSILNTSVYRGIPRDRALAAPALSSWFCDLVADDAYLAETGLVLLGEVASVSVAHPAFEAVPDVPYQHTEMLGAIWRDSVEGHLRPGETAITLAALLHRDPAGTALVEPLVARSGLTPIEWVDRLHEISLPPLAHVLYRYGAAFSPHAQNCLVVLRDHVPVRLVVKDFVDDAMISCEDLPELRSLPDEVRAALGGGLEGPLLVQWLQGGLLVCVHRYLSEIFADSLGLPEADFWASAARSLHRYQDRFADELDDRFALFEIDAPVFVKLCLNRVRMFERGYDDDAERPLASASGVIENPLFADRPPDPRPSDPRPLDPPGSGSPTNGPHP